jgi:RND family efflux transporter MFP subunit
MNPPRALRHWPYWLGATLLVAGVATGTIVYLTQNGAGPQRAVAHEAVHFQPQDEDPAPEPQSTPTTAVDVVNPQKGLDYCVEQPGDVRAYESVELQANVSGFLKVQNVDIGDRVKKGDILAVINLPEMQKQKQRDVAARELARERVHQMDAGVTSAQADRDAARAGSEQADANYKSAQAWVRYYDKVYHRRLELFKTRSIEEQLVDEAKEKYEASQETERSAKAAIATAAAKLSAAEAKIKQAEADVAGARAEVSVAQAELEKTQVMLDYTMIRAPFDGEICHRYFFPGDFIRSAASASTKPLLTVQRTDKLRVIVRLPESTVPYLDKGDPAYVRIDSLPGKKFVGHVSRKTGSQDPSTRLMHIEVDLPNPTGEISDGMYGQVKILLDRFPNLLSIPLASVVRTKEGNTAVWLVREGRLQLQEVQLGKDNGQRVAVKDGLKADDQVVRTPSSGLTVGAEVDARLVAEPPATEVDA